MHARQLAERLVRAWSTGDRRVTPAGMGLEVMIGLDHQAAGKAYDWDGRRRRLDPRGPEVIFQYTVSGWGVFTDARTRPTRCLPGMCFTTITPSDHHYHLP